MKASESYIIPHQFDTISPIVIPLKFFAHASLCGRRRKGRGKEGKGNGRVTVADPDLQIRGGGGGIGGHPDPDIKGGEVSKNLFSALRTSVWSKNKEGPPLDRPLD